MNIFYSGGKLMMNLIRSGVGEEEDFGLIELQYTSTTNTTKEYTMIIL